MIFVFLLFQLEEQVKQIKEEMSEIDATIHRLNGIKSKTILPKKSRKTEIPLILESVDTSRTKTYEELKASVFIFQNHTDKLTAAYPFLTIDTFSARFTYTPIKPSFASEIVFAKYPRGNCTVRQFTLEFYLKNKLMYDTPVIDLPSESRTELRFDLETYVEFDSVVFDLKRNFGNEGLTCLNKFWLM